MDKEMKKLHKAAEELGFEFVRKTGKSHYLYKHVETHKTVTLPGTPSDPRSFKNALSKLRKQAK
ncbi:HicA-like toxin [Arthrobacter phage Ottawa]|nr:HicA-like toxin [Arthrobacter phage Kharcho]WIC89267.1 HicA-like toxin [Arthrobacter phage Ottawa]